jgi:cation diffusion facilitator CzcD-associated flavoprotein CzcO
MLKVKYLILGAGPSGLSVAARLKQVDETSFLVIEKGGDGGELCWSREVDGSPFDIGGDIS